MEHIRNFQDYNANEGKTFKSTKKEHPKHDWDPDKKEQFRSTIKNHIQSQSCKTKQIGDDFEIHIFGKHIGQVMFRKDYISVKKVGDKFNKQFKYVELGKIKSEISKIIKDSKDKINESFENLYQGLDPKRAIEKAKIDYNHAIKTNNDSLANKISGNLKSHLDSQRYDWKKDPYALDILSDFVETNEAAETFAERKARRAKEIEEAKGKTKCPECYGSGTVNTEDKDKNCKKCSGTGKIDKHKKENK